MKILDGIEKKQVPLNFKCEFCNIAFAKESTFLVHVCDKKRRFYARNEKHVRAGLMTFQRFFELSQPSAKPKTYDEFDNSRFYTAFVKFGSFLVNTQPIYQAKFIDYVIKSGVKVDKWCDDKLYEAYVSELIKIEPADGAIQRTLLTMVEWGKSAKVEWEYYFSKVNGNRAVHDIREGLISPWILLNSKAGKSMLERFTDEQLHLVSLVIDPSFWIKRFKQSPADVELVKEILREVQLK